MRIRRKPWARPELDACLYYIKRPMEQRGRWAECYPRRQPFHIELGCGKGGFIAAKASADEVVNYLALDLKSDMLGLARRKAEQAYEAAGRPVDNLCLTVCNVEQIDTILAPEDRVERIYINFCNPWPKPRHYKKRLTHSRWLEKYKAFLLPEGQIHFKTDDDELFEASIEYFAQGGFETLLCTWDLYAQGVEGNVPTEHEQMFRDRGKTIKMLIARVAQK